MTQVEYYESVGDRFKGDVALRAYYHAASLIPGVTGADWQAHIRINKKIVETLEGMANG